MAPLSRRHSLRVAAATTSVALTEEVVRRHQQGIWRYLRFLGAQPSMADDLTQETFLALLSGAPEDRGDAATAGWLRTVARRLYSRQGTLRRGLQYIADEDLEAAWLRGEGSEDGRQGDAYGDALDTCLQALAPKARRAVDLRYRDESSREQMATALNISTEGVKTLLRRTRTTLLACIEGKTRNTK